MLLKPGLYIVSTPIGNLGDITIRALNVLKDATVILCEDTRISQKLLTKYNIAAKKLQIYNDQSDVKNREFIFRLIDSGEIVALISDAGTPLISDPGYKLVRALRVGGYHIDIIPGASSPIAALCISGMPSDRFLFMGFLPKTTAQQTKLLMRFNDIEATLIFFESASRLHKTLLNALNIFGNREACVVRELTKLYQDVKCSSLSELAGYYESISPRGEIVLLISGRKEQQAQSHHDQDIHKLLVTYLSSGITTKNATNLVYMQFKTSYSKREIYSIANKIKLDIVATN